LQLLLQHCIKLDQKYTEEIQVGFSIKYAIVPLKLPTIKDLEDKMSLGAYK